MYTAVRKFLHSSNIHAAAYFSALHFILKSYISTAADSHYICSTKHITVTLLCAPFLKWTTTKSLHCCALPRELSLYSQTNILLCKIKFLTFTAVWKTFWLCTAVRFISLHSQTLGIYALLRFSLFSSPQKHLRFCTLLRASLASSKLLRCCVSHYTFIYQQRDIISALTLLCFSLALLQLTHFFFFFTTKHNNAY